jgi:predicted esterase
VKESPASEVGKAGVIISLIIPSPRSSHRADAGNRVGLQPPVEPIRGDEVTQACVSGKGHHSKVIFGFSQGAAMASRWFNQLNQSGNALVLWGGEVAAELKPDMAELGKKAIYSGIWLGDNDPFIPHEAIEKVKAEKIAGWELEIFNGAHEVPSEALDVLKTTIRKLS